MEPPYEISIDQDLHHTGDTRNADAPPARTRPLADASPAEIAGLLGGSAVLLGAAAALGWLLYATVTGLAAMAVTGVHAGADASRHLLDWLTHGPITGTIIGPVRAYLDTHASGLPATGHQLWITWLALTAILLLTAALGSTGARLGWTLLGALTTAMVYAGTPSHGQALAAGLTAGLWALLSIPAFRRRGDRGITVVTPPAPSTDPA